MQLCSYAIQGLVCSQILPISQISQIFILAKPPSRKAALKTLRSLRKTLRPLR
jgi:hypothetical protein